MKAISVVKKASFGPLVVEFYGDLHGEFYMTRYQIGRALGYKYPRQAIEKIHKRFKTRLDGLSTVTILGTVDGKQREVFLYSARGVYEICRHSERPEANAFFDFAYTILEALRTGFVRLEGEKTTQLWQNVRALSKDTRKEETDAIADFVEYASAHGSKNAVRYYTTLSKLANATAGIVSRDYATAEQLYMLHLAERIIAGTTATGIDAQRDYHKIFAECRTKLQELSRITAYASQEVSYGTQTAAR